MDMEARVVQAMTEELQRQAEESAGELTVAVNRGAVRVSGAIDMEALAMIVVGTLAGGP